MSKQIEDGRGLIELLVESGHLPSFDLPVDSVPFQAQYYKNFISHHRQRRNASLSSALGQWLPGRRLEIEKTIYEIYGILVPYVPRHEDDSTNDNIKLNRFDYFLSQPENEKYLVSCGICNLVLDGNDRPISMLPPEQKRIAEEGGKCPICNSQDRFLELRWIKPPGYGPKVINQEPKTESSKFKKGNIRNSGRVRWPIQYGAMSSNYDEIRTLSDGQTLVALRSDGLERLTQIVGEPWVIEGSEINEYGFQICESCGAFNQDSSHARPYPIHGLSEPMWKKWKKKSSDVRYCSGSPISLLLGRPFRSSILSISIPLSGLLINLMDFVTDQRKYNRLRNQYEMAGFTLGRVIIDEVSNYYRLDFNEFDCDVRFNQRNGTPNIEIFFFETSEGGSGNLEQFWPFVLGMFSDPKKDSNLAHSESQVVRDSVESRLNGSRCKVLVPDSDGKFQEYQSHPCEKACNGCLLDYRNSANERRLHRERAYHLFLYMQGRLDDLRNPSMLNLSSSLIQFSNRIKEEEEYEISTIMENGKLVQIKITNDESDEEVIVEAVSDLIIEDVEEDIYHINSNRLIRDPDGVISEIEEEFD